MFGWLGQVDPDERVATRGEVKEIIQEEKQGFSRTDKIMIAGVVLSAAGLIWQIWRTR